MAACGGACTQKQPRHATDDSDDHDQSSGSINTTILRMFEGMSCPSVSSPTLPLSPPPSSIKYSMNLFEFAHDL
eukprot:352441-Chlamydomonas_euryale.AAC.6